ncbi:MAG: PAS domain S-box protein, partial [Cyanobacteria bacterium P01_D01_bin.73]
AKILVPLLCGDTLWGLLNVSESDFSRNWTPEDVEFLKALSVQLAIAIQQATTHQQLQDELKERQLAEMSLQESEQRYAMLAAAVPVGIFRADLQGQCTYLNDRWCQMTELRPEDALGEKWRSVIHPDDRDRVLRDWLNAAQAGQPLELEFRYKTASGKVTWVYGQSVPEWGETGEVIGHVGTITDISDRKQAETALQNLIAGTAATTGQDFFPALATHIAAALHASYAVVTALGEDNCLETLAFWANGKLQPPFSYRAPNTPCEQTLDRGRFFCGKLLAEKFPKGEDGDLDLAAMQAQSYLGVALHDSQGEAIGNLCILDTKPITDPERAEQLLVVFAARASAELERQRASTQLKRLNQELEAKVAERTATLREREEFLQTVLDTFPLSVFWKDRDCVMRGCNQEFVRTLGVQSSDEIVGKSTLDLSMSPEEAAAYQEDDLRVMNSGKPELAIEESLTRPDGETRWLETNRLPLRDGDGNVVGIVGTFQDITARKEAELKLRAQAEQERLLSGITQRVRSSLSLSDLLKSTAADLHQLLQSEILEATVAELHQVLQADRVLVYEISEDGTGTAIAESVSAEYSTLLDQALPAAAFPAIASQLDGNRPSLVLNDVEQEIDRISSSLAELLTEVQVRAQLVMPIVQQKRLWGLLVAHQCQPRQWKLREIKLLQQTADHIAIAIQQVHLFEQLQAELKERHQTQEQLTERNQQLAVSNEQLARATRLKDEFLANMSHELRTPLNAILGMTEGLQDTVFGPITPQQSKALNTLEGSGIHLLELINDILDVAKIEAGQIELHCGPTPVETLCQSSLTFIRQQAKKKQIQVHLWVPPHLPYLMVDERRIRQVLLNLLNNAVKFTPEGGTINLTVTRRSTLNIDAVTTSYSQSSPALPPPTPLEECKGDQSYLHIAITDTGIGISPENITRLFKPFIQIDSALNRQYNGTGLGLALVKRIVELHGGQVKVVSEEGKGSSFIISLPCVVTRSDCHPASHTSLHFGVINGHDPSTMASPVILLA